MEACTWRQRLLALLVLVFAVVLFFGRLQARALWSEEVRWAEIPREMERSGDYFQPTFNGKTYYDKPLGSYWLVLAIKALTGADQEMAARLPCALAGLLSVWFIMRIAARLFGPAVAPLAGLILATSFSFVFFARHASTDVETIAGVLGALWLFLAHEHRPDGWWTLLLWTIMALTSLTKGLLGFVLPLAIIASYRLCTHEPTSSSARWAAGRILASQGWLCHRKTLLAIPVALAIYLSPFIISSVRTGSHEGLTMVFRENIRRFYDPVNHRGPVYLYAGVVFELLAPWSILLPAALWQLHRKRSAVEVSARGERFALAFFWTVFVFFTLSVSRRSYYLLPILPAAALLIAQLLVQKRADLLTCSRWLMLGGLNPRRLAFALGIVASIGMVAIFLVALPALESTRSRKPFAEEVQRLVGSDMDHLALYHERDVVFYLAPSWPLAEYATEQELAEAIDHGQVEWVIARRSDLEKLKTTLVPVLHETESPWEWQIQRNAKLVLLAVRRGG